MRDGTIVKFTTKITDPYTLPDPSIVGSAVVGLEIVNVEPVPGVGLVVESVGLADPVVGGLVPLIVAVATGVEVVEPVPGLGVDVEPVPGVGLEAESVGLADPVVGGLVPLVVVTVSIVHIYRKKSHFETTKMGNLYH